MDVSRRHLIGASAAGTAGALALARDAARARTADLDARARCRPLRPASRQPRRPDPSLQPPSMRPRARGRRCAAPGRYRAGNLAAGRRTAHRRARRDPARSDRRSLAHLRAKAPAASSSGLTLDGGGPLADTRGLVHASDLSRDADRRLRDRGLRRPRHPLRRGRRRGQRQHAHRHRRRRDPVLQRGRTADRPQHHHRGRQQRHPDHPLGNRRRRHHGDRQPHREHATVPAAPASTATPSTRSAPAT